jgi:biopolymer transport protein ExbD
MSASMSHEANAEPNLTPILDMVFQLITFFMLVINFKTAAMDFSLRLPVVGSARPADNKGQEELLVLNVDKAGHLNVYGEQKTDIERYIATEAQASLFFARKKHPELEAGDELPTTVVVRADKATPFRLLNKIISTCQNHGYRKFSLKAMNKEQEQ